MARVELTRTARDALAAHEFRHVDAVLDALGDVEHQLAAGVDCVDDLPVCGPFASASTASFASCTTRRPCASSPSDTGAMPTPTEAERDVPCPALGTAMV